MGRWTGNKGALDICVGPRNDLCAYTYDVDVVVIDLGWLSEHFSLNDTEDDGTDTEMGGLGIERGFLDLFN